MEELLDELALADASIANRQEVFTFVAPPDTQLLNPVHAE
jgi:hypothetical protein